MSEGECCSLTRSEGECCSLTRSEGECYSLTRSEGECCSLTRSEGECCSLTRSEGECCSLTRSEGECCSLTRSEGECYSLTRSEGECCSLTRSEGECCSLTRSEGECCSLTRSEGECCSLTRSEGECCSLTRSEGECCSLTRSEGECCSLTRSEGECCSLTRSEGECCSLTRSEGECCSLTRSEGECCSLTRSEGECCSLTRSEGECCSLTRSEGECCSLTRSEGECCSLTRSEGECCSLTRSEGECCSLTRSEGECCSLSRSEGECCSLTRSEGECCSLTRSEGECCSLTRTGESVKIELSGSPKSLIHQKPGVLYAVNACGPAYQALTGVVYTSEHHQFVNFSYDKLFGDKYKSLGGMKVKANISEILKGTHDGFLHCSNRNPGVEAEDEKRVIFEVDDIPNGNHTLRLHLVDKPNSNAITVNGTDISHKINKVPPTEKKKSPGGEGNIALVRDIPIEVTKGKFKLKSSHLPICAFAILDATYQDDQKTSQEIDVEEEMKISLSNTLKPLTRSMVRKEMNIIGWSPNILQNPSGQDRLAHWNTTGNWNVQEGGYGTEKAFVSSFTQCVRYQEIHLFDHFTSEYLSTCPDIQVSEWYREGCCGGGYYSMQCSLLDAGGHIIEQYDTGRLGNLYKENQWFEACKTFSGYKTPAHTVTLSSSGQDDKHWAGHYGPMMSNSMVRVKRETKAASNDNYGDIDLNVAADGSPWTSKRDKLIAKVLSDGQELLMELQEEEAIPTLDAQFEKQTSLGPIKRQRKKKQEIRVFVSSTFKDFSKEREQVIKKTFREGVFFTYVDLRWGITTEQTTHGKTIAICLQEIERCRPYFLCMLGMRFGWSQKQETPDNTLQHSYDYAVENHQTLKWIDDYRFNTSVTQLEVFHGVLNDIPKRRDRSFFYLRAPPVREEMTEDEFRVCSPESDWHEERQSGLRDMVRNQGTLNVRDFKYPEEVSEMIKKDLEWSINEDFPKGTELTPLEREREAHQAFADARCRVYIGGENYFAEINKTCDSGLSKPYVILGESGSGKSALIANWTRKMEESDPNTFVFYPFYWLYEEMKEFFQFDMPIPQTDVNMIRDLGNWLKLAGNRHKTIIVFDALNQLDDGTGEEGAEHDLQWIPGEVPPNVFLLLSALPGRAMDAVNGMGWPTLKVEPLDISEKTTIITNYLEGIHGKTLNEEQKKMMVDAPQTNNPLYLKSLMDEVRMYGSFGTLTAKIMEYLTATSPGDLFAKILERLEEDFEKGEEGREYLVRDATTAIWCSHRGMSEAELVDFLDVPSAVWSPFYLSLAENLVNRNGILNFFHDHLRRAVETKYLNSQESKIKFYKKLAEFFQDKQLDDRVVDELPFLLAKAGELIQLRQTISNLDVFSRLVRSEEGKFDLIKSWNLLGDFSQVDGAYIEQLSAITDEDRKKEDFTRLLDDLGAFFIDLGLLEAARTVYEKLLMELDSRYGQSHSTVVANPFGQSWTYRCKHPAVITALHKLGIVCDRQSEFDQAVLYYKDAISRQNRISSPDQKLMMCEGLLGLSNVYYLKENMPESKKLMVRALELSTEVLGKRHHYVAAILNKLGQLCYKQTRLDEALGYYLQDLKLTRSEVGTSHPRTAVILNDIALVYDDMNKPLAQDLYEAALAVFVDTYGSAHVDVAVVRYNLAAYYFATNYFARAKFHFQQAHLIFQSFFGDDHPDTKAAQKALDEVPS
ncbi:hypothetical protein ScPMuIL_008088 [Solemya velum]